MDARRLTPDAAALVPTAFALAMLGVAYGLRGTPPVAAATMGAAAFLLIGGAALALGLRRSGRRPCLAVVMRKPHYVQALAQSSLWAYWAWHVPEVRAFAPLVLVQLLFSYGFSVLLTWVRRERYELGVRSSSHHPINQLLPHLQARMVRVAVRDHRPRVSRQGIHPMGPGRGAQPTSSIHHPSRWRCSPWPSY